jgi:putative endonuclease
MNLGDFGEERAANYLTSQGYEILCRNFRCKRGEIDIVSRDKIRENLIVFFEVKTRRNRGFGLPCEAVTPSKIHKMKRAIKVYTSIHKCGNYDLRIDVIEILLLNKKTYIRHIKNVF